MIKKIPHISLFALLIVVCMHQTAQADSIFTRFKNNIIDTLNYRRLSLTASALGLGCAAYSSNPTVRRVLASLSLLNVLRTWCQAPNRYTLEGAMEMAARDVIGFSMTFLDHKSSDNINNIRIQLILAMEDLAQNQDLDLKNDVLALKLAINNIFTQANEEKKKNKDFNLTASWAQTLKDFFKVPSQIKSNKAFQNIRSKFNDLEGIVEIASQINPLKPTTPLAREFDEALPINNYIYFRDRDANERPHNIREEEDKQTARTTLINALKELKSRTTNASLIKDIEAFISTANAPSVTFDKLDELVRNPNTIKDDSVYQNFRNQRPGVY